MEDFITEMVDTIPSVIKNTRFSLVLSGWPAAVSVFAVCTTVVAISYFNSQGQTN